MIRQHRTLKKRKRDKWLAKHQQDLAILCVVVGLWDELCRMADKKKAEKMLKDGDDQWQ